MLIKWWKHLKFLKNYHTRSKVCCFHISPSYLRSMTYGTMALIEWTFPNHANLWSPHFGPCYSPEHSFLRRMLIPTSVIAGFIGLGLKYLFNETGMQIDGLPLIDSGVYECHHLSCACFWFYCNSLLVKRRKKSRMVAQLKAGYSLHRPIQFKGLLVSLVQSFLLPNFYGDW